MRVILVEFAWQTKEIINNKSFYKDDLIVSLGVLHHTNNCLEGIKKIIHLSPEYILLGLYHKFGRKPLLYIGSIGMILGFLLLGVSLQQNAVGFISLLKDNFYK